MLLFATLIWFIVSCKAKGGKKDIHKEVDQDIDEKDSIAITVVTDTPCAPAIDNFKKKGLGKND